MDPGRAADRATTGDTPSPRLGAWFADRGPALAVLFVAPWFGEAVTTSTPALDLLLPWTLAFMAALYGCGALLCREVARRAGMGLPGLALLGAAYGVWEEALVDRYWFAPAFWAEMEVGSYGVVGGANLLLATHLTVFHAVVSVCASVVVVEHLFPRSQRRPWVGRTGLVAAGLALFVAVPFAYGEFDDLPPARSLAAAAALCAAFVVAAFLAPRPTPATAPSAPPHRRRGLAWIAFLCASAHILLVYAVAQTPLPWPVGIAVAVAPVVVGVVLVRRMATGGPYGRDALLVVGGVLAYHLSLGAGVGLAGRYDVTVAAVLTAAGLVWLYRRHPGSAG